MKIFLTNDDGIHAIGLLALQRALKDFYKILIVAPDKERSAVGHGITLHEPIRANKVDINGVHGYALSGTPVDCIKFGLLELLDDRPDMVISGINPGANTGVNINYSGTVAAAREATLYGIPSMAVSICSPEPEYYEEAASFITRLTGIILKNRLPFGTFLNINIPNVSMAAISGIRLSHQGVTFPKEYIEKKVDPRNQPYYWQGAVDTPEFIDPEEDGAALNDNHIAITPIKCDMTDNEMIEELKTWELSIY
ncbi:MAG: 5'/3'-nucleotidase SurE [Deltaproteobacteria bacterium]|nr:5'/3'-nucleotidase SurE [Deltaproteobacteria bacterium]